ncbi:MAG: peptidyl-prolyl cis-trans isomerase [Sphingomonadales bacterium]
MKRILKDPLVHFLLAGLLMFGAFMALNPEGGGEEDPTRIVVDRPALLEFLQFRTRAFEPERAAAVLDGMGKEELDGLIRDFVREEALYREAKALGLDRTDYVIKRRLVQTVEFVAGNATAPEEADEKAVERYFAENSERYAAPESVTFTHVFFELGQGGRDAAAKRAAEALAAMNAKRVAFSDAPGWGDRFAYNLNYVDRPKDAVAGHFGGGFADRVFALPADPARWQGPLESPYGFHVVMVTGHQQAQVPPLADIRDRVRADYLAGLAAERQERLIDDMIAHYEIDVNVDRDGAARAASR